MGAGLEVVRSEQVLTIRVARPEKRNALDVATSRALAAVLDEVVSDPRPLVVRSSTRGMFIAGTDIDELRRRSITDSLDRVNGRLYQRLAEHPAPTIAVVEGWALGGGCELALACDLRLTTADAQWGLPEVRLGIVPSAGGLTRLTELIGRSLATDLVLTGRRIGGAEAYRIGLAQRLIDADRLESQLSEVLSELLAAAPLASRLAKEALRVTGDRHRLVDAAAQALCLDSEDAQARLSALVERAAP